MNCRLKATALVAPMLAAALTFANAQPHPEPGQPPRHWAATWIAPAQPLWGSDFALPLGMPQALQDSTLRQFLRTSIGGDRIRIVVDNQYSDQPLKIGRAHVATLGSHGRGVPVRFDGQEGVVVAAGAKAVSDPVDLAVAAGTRLQADLYLPEPTRLGGFHWDARDQTLLIPGDRAGLAAPQDAQVLSTRAFVSSVLVQTAARPSAVVALGDSITDGNGATPGADKRWPDFLAGRLAPRGVAVLNAGISGNRLLRPGMGEAGLARLGKDVLEQPGVGSVIVLLGTNDIGWPGGPFAPAEKGPSVDDLSRGLRQLVAQAHVHGVRVIGATVPPFEDALKGTPLEGHYSPAKEAVRQALNAWIRTAGAFDAVVDFDKELRDPSRPTRLRPEYDSGDHLHPNDAGYEAMANVVNLQALLMPEVAAR
ncbi:MAG: SGNH/GDSL hydrolase family protein [Proteobacteria bacterium]|nr:SGNH/GDSL hydrolase family protein [Pseudomonadota bacterium]